MSTLDPTAFDIKETRQIIHDERVLLYVLLGVNAQGKVGGWWRKEVPPVAALKVLHDLLATRELDESWERGYPHGAGRVDRRKFNKVQP